MAIKMQHAWACVSGAFDAWHRAADLRRRLRRERQCDGYVFAITRCGGSGRGGGYHTTTYSTWLAVTWDLGGRVIEEAPSVPSPDPSIAGVYHSGGLVGGANYPSCNNVAAYDNSFTCFSLPVKDSVDGYAVQTWLHVVNQAACTASNTAYCSYRA